MSTIILKRIGLSLLIFIFWVAMLYIFFYRDHGRGLGKDFDVVILLMFTQFFSIATGVIVLILRVAKLLSVNSFFYIFSGVLNLCICIYFLIDYLITIQNLHRITCLFFVAVC